MNEEFILPFDQVSISTEDETYIYNLLKSHDRSKVLDYHGYLHPKLTFKTKFAQELKAFGDTIDLRLAGIYAFTANANTTTSIHIDGNIESGPLPWRICWYCRGDAGTLSWYPTDSNTVFDNHVGAYVLPHTIEPIATVKLNMKSAIIRTEIPHLLDLSGTTVDRLTITATFKPYISWQELRARLNNVKTC
jgi:hypothetical protein